jgi:hypothetical protein
MLPLWYDDVWRKKKPNALANEKNISDSVYMPLLGTRAITDDKPLTQADQQKLVQKQADEATRESGITENESSGASQPQQESVNTILGKDKVVVPTGSIEEAINGLAMVYGLLKEKGEDVHEFINDYTYREIATMKQILGDRHLEYNDQGRVKDPTTMVEGFHSRAFGDYNTDPQEPERNNAAGEPQDPIPGTNAMHLFYVGIPAAAALNIKRPPLVARQGPQLPVKAYLDPRGRASSRVQDYVRELKASRGLFGV